MSEYTSTREGFQRAMKLCLTCSSAEESKAFAETLVTPSFYHINNGKRAEYDAWFADMRQWTAKITGYDPVIHEFLRDGSQLGARMSGALKVEGVDMFFESFIFAKIEEKTGKVESLVERAVFGPIADKGDMGQ